MEKQVNMKKPWREKVKMDNNSKGKNGKNHKKGKIRKTIKGKNEKNPLKAKMENHRKVQK